MSTRPADKAATRHALSFEANAFQSFVRGLRAYWRDEAYQATVAEAAKLATDDLAEIERSMHASPHYQLYAWLERHSQQFKYYGRYGIVATAEAQKPRFAALLAAAAKVFPERLRLDPAFTLPGYVRDVDTHQHGGGIWSDACDAFAYETSSTGFTFSLFDPRSPLDAYTECVRARLARYELTPKCIVDLGCTIGGSTRALKRAFAPAEVHGCDVCAPVLALAHLRSLEAGLAITYWQKSAENPGFADGSVDAVASHWLFHEMPPRAIRHCLAAARRMLRPGGAFVAYDMYLAPGGAIGRWLHAGYAARNNEPYAHAYASMDMGKELEAAGFEDITIELAHPVPSDEVRAGALPPARTHYMTLVSASVPRGSGATKAPTGTA